MKSNRITQLIAIAAICWVFLILLQGKWIRDAHRLNEKQFDQKVTMALCAAVNELDSTSHVSCGYQVVTPDPSNSQFQVLPQDGSNEPVVSIPESEIRAALDKSLAFYDIHLDYQIEVGSNQTPGCDPASPYCCALFPFETEGDQAQLNIFFPGKKQYILGRMWLMLVASIFMMLFLLGVFIMTIRALIRQKRVSQFNIDFFNNMAHEFKTPLTNIRLALKRLELKNPNLTDDQYVAIIRKEDQKLADQIEGVLGLARIESGEYRIKKEPIQVYTLLNEVIQDMHLLISEHGATVEIDPSIKEFSIVGDRVHLSRAFVNLIDNSLKYCDQSPQIKITGHHEGEMFTLVFKDNGIGLNKADRKIIFEKFHRIGHTYRPHQKGFGLGLSYVKAIIQQHRGSIAVKSNEHNGSTFELQLPTTIA